MEGRIMPNLLASQNSLMRAQCVRANREIVIAPELLWRASCDAVRLLLLLLLFVQTPLRQNFSKGNPRHCARAPRRAPCFLRVGVRVLLYCIGVAHVPQLGILYQQIWLCVFPSPGRSPPSRIGFEICLNRKSVVCVFPSPGRSPPKQDRL